VNFYPDPPPHLHCESENAYRQRLVGSDNPYDHARARECALLDHENCTNPFKACFCPCHFQPEEFDKVAWILNVEEKEWELVNFSIESQGRYVVYCSVDAEVLALSDRRFAAGVLKNTLDDMPPELRARALSCPWMDPNKVVAR